MAPLAILAASSLALIGCSTVNIHTGMGPGDAGKADGVVTVYGTISGSEAKLLQQSWADWEEENRIQIKYTTIYDLKTQLDIRTQDGTAPDLAIFSQPGLVADLALRNLIQPTPYVVKANLKEYWSSDWEHSVTTDDVVYGAPLMASVKGLIWYSPKKFASHGWEVPTTWDSLVALTSDMHKKLGVAPWCVDFGADAATGELGTDWLEDVVLRQAGPYTYDGWVRHDVKFSDPVIKGALHTLEKILLNPDYVNTDFGDEESTNPNPTDDLAMAMGNGTCLLTHQDMTFGEVLADPENADLTVSPGGDVWAFLMPSFEAGGNAVTGSGKVVAAFSNDADTIRVQQYLSSPEWANSRVVLGGAISANNGVDPATASSPILTTAINILQDPKTTFRFDASEAMPPVVGEASFPSGMSAWINNWSVDDLLSTIDASWSSDQRRLPTRH